LSKLVVQGVESLGIGTVKVKPPIADEVVLVEDGSVGAEEGPLGPGAIPILGTDVEHLALGLGVGVVASNFLTLAGECGFGDLAKNGVVFAWGSGN